MINIFKVMGHSQRKKRTRRRLEGNFQRERSQEKVSMRKMWWLFFPKLWRRSKGSSHMSTGSGPVSNSLPHLDPNCHPFCHTSHTWLDPLITFHCSCPCQTLATAHCHRLPHHHNLPFISHPCQTWPTLWMIPSNSFSKTNRPTAHF